MAATPIIVRLGSRLGLQALNRSSVCVRTVWHFPFSIKCLLIFAYFNCCRIRSYAGTANMRERRKNFRVEWNSSAKIYDCNGYFVRLCIVGNFSNGGATIACVEPGTVPGA